MNDKLYRTIAEVLGVPEDAVNESTSASSESRWDSLRHMNLILSIEEAFGVRFDDDEIPKITSVTAIEAALKKRL